MKNHSILLDENELIWLHDPALFPFVRQGWLVMAGRNRAVSLSGDREKVLIGYMTLKPKAEGLGQGRFFRRFFYLSSWDHQGNTVEYLPCESVDPFTVSAKIEGQQTERCHIPTTPEQRKVIKSLFAAKKKK